MNEQALRDFFLQMDRSFFINNEYKDYATHDMPLPIGFGQTISQPTLVLEMTHLLAPEKDSRVLEIGTGSGYQTALLAEFSAEVYTVERIRELSEQAQQRLSTLGYHNIFYKIGDGSKGWSEKAPFDRIMVTASAGKKPEELIKQLSPGGRMIVPVGPPEMQELFLITRDKEGTVHTQSMERVKFVEMVGIYGWDSCDKP
jgi:protein-L-isoaspartate(D-aspartate) O-methyltransferase